jgi:hypothetical protein
MDNTSEADTVFDWEAIREACRSFLDSIEESPKDAKRFPQTLWSAIGDLSVNIFHLRELFELILANDISFKKPWIFLNF